MFATLPEPGSRISITRREASFSLPWYSCMSFLRSSRSVQAAISNELSTVDIFKSETE